MPTYDCECDKECGGVITDHFKLMNDPYPPCPKCGGPMHTVFNRSNIAFKGLTTPGNAFPKPVKDWLEKRKDQIRETGK